MFLIRFGGRPGHRLPLRFQDGKSLPEDALDHGPGVRIEELAVLYAEDARQGVE